MCHGMQRSGRWGHILTIRLRDPWLAEIAFASMDLLSNSLSDVDAGCCWIRRVPGGSACSQINGASRQGTGRWECEHGHCPCCGSVGRPTPEADRLPEDIGKSTAVPCSSYLSRRKREDDRSPEKKGQLVEYHTQVPPSFQMTGLLACDFCPDGLGPGVGGDALDEFFPPPTRWAQPTFPDRIKLVQNACPHTWMSVLETSTLLQGLAASVDRCAKNRRTRDRVIIPYDCSRIARYQ